MTPPPCPVRVRTLEKEVRQLAAEYQGWFDEWPDQVSAYDLAANLEETIEMLERVAEDLWAIDPPCIGTRS